MFVCIIQTNSLMGKCGTYGRGEIKCRHASKRIAYLFLIYLKPFEPVMLILVIHFFLATDPS